VMDILLAEQDRDPKRAPTVEQARCKCGVPLTQTRMPYQEEE